jgi:hypothetical protein
LEANVSEQITPDEVLVITTDSDAFAIAYDTANPCLMTAKYAAPHEENGVS